MGKTLPISRTYRYSDTEWYPAVKFKVSSKNVQGKKILIVAEVVDKFPQKFKNDGLSEEFSMESAIKSHDIFLKNFLKEEIPKK